MSPTTTTLAGETLNRARLEQLSGDDAGLLVFDGADLRGADIAGLKLFNAKLFKGATISHRQAAALMLELGLNVA